MVMFVHLFNGSYDTQPHAFIYVILHNKSTRLNFVSCRPIHALLLYDYINQNAIT